MGDQTDYNFVSFKKKKQRNLSNINYYKEEIQKQLDPIVKKNYQGSRHFFSYMTHELCYHDTEDKRNESNIESTLQLPQIKTQLSRAASIKKRGKDATNSLIPNRTNNLIIDIDTINQSVYQSHNEEAQNETENKIKAQKIPNDLIGPQSDSDSQSDQEANSQRVGLPSINKYYEKFKTYDKSIEKNKHLKQAPLAYLKKCGDFNLIPSPLGMVSMKGQNDQINIREFQIGDKYAEAIGNGLKLSVANKLNLASNRLNPKGGMKILEGLNYGVREIDFSNNRLGETSQCIEQIGKSIQDRRFQFEVLILDSNRVNDFQVHTLCESLIVASYKPLRVLSLRENLITDVGVKPIAEMLDINTTGLRELRLGWNNIQGPGGKLIADALKSNNRLKVLDLSWNSIGSHGISPVDIGTTWGISLADNKSLQHLDLSFNKIKKADTEILAEKLKSNHTIYGIHYQGNEGRADSLGFIRSVLNSGKDQHSPREQILSSRVDGNSTNRKKNRSIFHSPKASIDTNSIKINYNPDNCCWICEGWKEHLFKFDLYKVMPDVEITDDIKDTHYNVFIHFDFDFWEPDLTEDLRKINLKLKGNYQSYRMVPQGVSYYFYSYEGKAFVNSNEKQIELDDFLKDQIKKTLSTGENRFGVRINGFDLTHLNFIDTSQRNSTSYVLQPQLPRINKEVSPSEKPNEYLVISEKYEVLIKNCVPRQNKLLPANSYNRVRTPWTYEVSLFKEYLREDKEELIIDCFEFDWKNMKQLKYKKSSEEEVKETMRKTYRLIKEFYKIQAGYGMAGTVFSVALNQYTDFIKEQIGLMDGTSLNQSDCDRLFITVNANKRGPLIPANALVRFQFMEILIRLGVKRYFESGECPTEADACQMVIDQNLEPAKKNIQIASEWLKEKLFIENVDNILKAYQQLFLHIYNNFGGTHRKPGQKMFMTVDEFENFCLSVPLVNDLFGQREISVAFNLAMMTQINELEFERHLQATFIEFLNAFCRVVDQASFAPLNIQQNEEQSTPVMSIDERKKQPLHVKIENVIPYLIQNCAKRNFIEKQFEKPEKDLTLNLYILQSGKYFQRICFIVIRIKY